MIKQISITFDFDTETEIVSNIKTVGSTEVTAKKRTSTKKVKEIIEEMASEPIVILESNKLIFNNKSILDLDLKYEDRIVIKWINENKIMSPIIGKDISFDEEGTGNKVTKSNTVTYKGKANTILAEHGSEFKLEPYNQEGIWRLVAVSDTVQNEVEKPLVLENLIKQAEDTDLDLLVDSDENNEIDELQYKL